MRKFILLAINIFLISSTVVAGGKPSSCHLVLRNNSLIVPATHNGYFTLVKSTNVKKQCIGSCSIHSHVALLENIAGSSLDVNFNIMVTMLDKAKEFLKTPSKIRVSKEGSIDFMDGLSLPRVAVNTAEQGVL